MSPPEVSVNGVVSGLVLGENVIYLNLSLIYSSLGIKKSGTVAGVTEGMSSKFSGRDRANKPEDVLF